MLTTIHFIEWCIAAFLNILVLCFIIRYSPQTMGKYPWLLAGYTFFNMFFGTLDVILAPAPYIIGRTYLCVSWGEILTDQTLIYVLMVLYCSGFSQLLVFLSFQFFYRYVIVCKSYWLPKLKLWRILLGGVVFYVLVCGTWTLNSHIALNSDPEIFNYTNSRYQKLTGRSVIGTGSLAQAFEGVSTHIIIRSYIGMAVFSMVLTFTWSIIIYCGWSLNKTLEEKGKSSKTKLLQKELFKALIFQLLVPFLTVYLPMSFFFASAIIGFENWDTEIICIMLMLDPILEPLVLLYFIKCYRRPLFAFLCCGRTTIFGVKLYDTSGTRYKNTTGTNTNNQVVPESTASRGDPSLRDSTPEEDQPTL